MVADDTESDGAQNSTLRRRYAAKLGSNVVGLGVGVMSAGLIARLLGVENYGIFNYVSFLFAQAAGFLQIGSDQWAFQRWSKEAGDPQVTNFMVRLTLVLWGVLIVGLWVAYALGLGKGLWPDIDMRFMVWGCALVLINWLTSLLTQYFDAVGLTVQSELTSVVRKLVGFGGLLVLLHFDWNSLTSFFIYLVLMGLFWVFLLVGRLPERSKAHKNLADSGGEPIGRECWKYSHPLLVFGLAGLLANVGERWLLQSNGGSIEQGYLGLGLQIAAIIFMLAAPMTPLFTRELARCHQAGGTHGLRRCFLKMMPLIVAATASISVFICFNAADIVAVMGGSEFAAAGKVVALLALYPIYQAYCQLCSGFYYATGRTALYRNVGITMMVVGILATYIFVAPEKWGGLNLQANGIAIKILLSAVIAANVDLMIVSRCLRMSFLRRFFFPQCAILLLFGICSRLAGMGAGGVDHLMLRLVGKASIYGCLLFFVVWMFPFILGRRRDELKGEVLDAYHTGWALFRKIIKGSNK